MKKKISGICIIATMAVICTISINFSMPKQNSNMEFLLENIEAFANGGEGTGIKVTTCIGKSTPCKLADGTEGWGKPTQVEIDW